MYEPKEVPNDYERADLFDAGAGLDPDVLAAIRAVEFSAPEFD